MGDRYEEGFWHDGLYLDEELGTALAATARRRYND